MLFLYKEKKYDLAKDEYQKFLQDFPNDELAQKVNKRLEKIVKNLVIGGEEKNKVEKDK